MRGLIIVKCDLIRGWFYYVPMIACNGACETDFLTKRPAITLKIMLRYNNKKARDLREKKKIEKKMLEKSISKQKYWWQNFITQWISVTVLCLASTPWQEPGKRQVVIAFLQEVMKKSTHAHSALIQSRQFRARIARTECGHFNEVWRKVYFLSFKCVAKFEDTSSLPEIVLTGTHVLQRA